VRELEQCLARAAALSPDGAVNVGHLPEIVARALHSSEGGAQGLTEEEARLRDVLIAELTAHHGNIAHVARAMKKARMQVQRWIKRFEIDAEVFRRSRP
jgi:transcriptional regulator of acetoin/glycerol metabolism